MENDIPKDEALTDWKMSDDVFLKKSYLMWENNSNVCWLDASMSLLAHNKTLRHSIDGSTSAKMTQILEIVKNYNSAIFTLNDYANSSCIDTRLKTAKEMLRLSQESSLEYLQPFLKNKKGEPDSAFCSLLNLIAGDEQVKSLFEVDFQWSESCEMCKSSRKKSRQKKHIITLSRVSSFLPASPVTLRQCQGCKEPDQHMTLNYKTSTPCLIFHFESGAGQGELQSLDFQILDRQYSLTGVIMLEKGRDSKMNHFVTWIRNPASNMWLECNDLNADILSFSVVPPILQLENVYILMYETLDGRGTIPLPSNPNESRCSEEEDSVNGNTHLIPFIDLSNESDFPDKSGNILNKERQPLESEENEDKQVGDSLKKLDGIPAPYIDLSNESDFPDKSGNILNKEGQPLEYQENEDKQVGDSLKKLDGIPAPSIDLSDFPEKSGNILNKEVRPLESQENEDKQVGDSVKKLNQKPTEKNIASVLYSCKKDTLNACEKSTNLSQSNKIGSNADSFLDTISIHNSAEAESKNPLQNEPQQDAPEAAAVKADISSTSNFAFTNAVKEDKANNDQYCLDLEEEVTSQMSSTFSVSNDSKSGEMSLDGIPVPSRVAIINIKRMKPSEIMEHIAPRGQSHFNRKPSIFDGKDSMPTLPAKVESVKLQNSSTGEVEIPLAMTNEVTTSKQPASKIPKKKEALVSLTENQIEAGFFKDDTSNQVCKNESLEDSSKNVSPLVKHERKKTKGFKSTSSNNWEGCSTVLQKEALIEVTLEQQLNLHRRKSVTELSMSQDDNSSHCVVSVRNSSKDSSVSSKKVESEHFTRNSNARRRSTGTRCAKLDKVKCNTRIQSVGITHPLKKPNKPRVTPIKSAKGKCRKRSADKPESVELITISNIVPKSCMLKTFVKDSVASQVNDAYEIIPSKRKNVSSKNNSFEPRKKRNASCISYEPIHGLFAEASSSVNSSDKSDEHFSCERTLVMSPSDSKMASLKTHTSKTKRIYTLSSLSAEVPQPLAVSRDSSVSDEATLGDSEIASNYLLKGKSKNEDRPSAEKKAAARQTSAKKQGEIAEDAHSLVNMSQIRAINTPANQHRSTSGCGVDCECNNLETYEIIDGVTDYVLSAVFGYFQPFLPNHN